MITTTLNRIRDHSPCENGWEKLLANLGKTKADDEPLPFYRIVEINGLDDALWCCRAEPQYDREWRLFSVWCARQVQHLMPDPRSIEAIDVAERFANGEAAEEELAAARAAARAAADAAAKSAKAVALSAEYYAAVSAEFTAVDAAAKSAKTVANDASQAAVNAAAEAVASKTERDTANIDEWFTARSAARFAAIAAQKSEFLCIVGTPQKSEAATLASPAP